MKRLAHKFVDYIPEILEDGVIYISIPFRLVSHRCCCGCGEEVVLKLSPFDWRLIFDGENISIEPSIGNWNLKCRSHYWITKSCVRWAESWADLEKRHAHRLRKVSEFGRSEADATNVDAREEARHSTDDMNKGPFVKLKKKNKRLKR